MQRPCFCCARARCFGAGVQPALSSGAEKRRKRRRSWGLPKRWWRGEAALSQTLTHLPAGSWPLKAQAAACLGLLPTPPLPRFTPGSEGGKTTMGLFYSKSQVRKGKRRLSNERSRLPLEAEGTCCRRGCFTSCIFSSENYPEHRGRDQSRVSFWLGFVTTLCFGLQECKKF